MARIHDRDRDRERERKKRRRRDSGDDYEEEGGISGWKLGLVIGVIVVCFAMLYPTLFHPMLMGFLGRSPQPAASMGQQRPPIHPAMGGGGSRHPGGGHPSRPDVHPAMRMAQAQAEGQSGGSKGMFTWMLPIYTIGVVMFLLYTLFKSKGKKTKRKKRSNYLDSEEEDECDEDDSEAETKFGGKFGKKKLQGLQQRLRQTEEAMSKILEQLESVQAGAQPVDLDAAEQMADQLEEDVSAKEAVGLNETNEQYIKDLETALKEFQSLSKAYDKEKMRKLKRDESSSEEEEEEEASSDLSEIEEEKEITKKPTKQKKNVKSRQKSTSEEEDEKEKEKEKEDEDAEEEGIDIDSEIREQEEKDHKGKTVRRRRAQKT
ncbi:unnamed protein product [Caenorhabditis sp. 36 PRJEB53466]|nr:unnamed protein product [Caenorhabditis sp. 36 PRJEB53466]